MQRKNARIVVNLITGIRLFGTFLLPFVAIYLNALELVGYIFLLLITDFIDGMLARLFNVCTIFGALLDMISDKLLGVATLCVIASKYPIMLLPVLFEVIVSLVNTGGATRGSVMGSSTLGKIKTGMFSISILIGFLLIYANELISIVSNENFLKFLVDISSNSNIVVNNMALICSGADLMVIFDYYIRIKSDIKVSKSNGKDPKNYKLKNKKDLMYALFSTKYYHETKDLPLMERLGVLKEKNYERKN